VSAIGACVCVRVCVEGECVRACVRVREKMHKNMQQIVHWVTRVVKLNATFSLTIKKMEIL
jgi:hypothetical protein